MPDPFALADRYRAALLKREAAASNALVEAYSGVWRRLQPEITALEVEWRNLGDEMKPGSQFKLERLKALREQVTDEIETFGSFTDSTLDVYGMASVRAAAAETRALTAAMLPEGAASIMASWTALPVDAVVSALGFLQPGGELRRYIRESWGQDAGRDVEKALVEGLALGRNPRTVAREVVGRPLTDALRLSRTVLVNAHREGGRAQYMANPGIADEYIWSSARDVQTCFSCLVMDGKRFPMSVPLTDHWQGRCQPLPVPNIYADLGIDPPAPDGPASGEEWFASLPESQQRAMMDAKGRGLYDAFRRGDFQFAQLSRVVQDSVWGDMRVEAAVKDLVKDVPKEKAA